MTRNPPAKKNRAPRLRALSRGALCALCLLLGAALLVACAPDASNVSEPAEPGLSAVGMSGDRGSPSLPEGAGLEASGSGVSGSGAPDSDAPGTGAFWTGSSGAESISAQGEASVNTSVSAAGTDSPADDENLCHLPLAPGTGPELEFPEADRALARF